MEHSRRVLMLGLVNILLSLAMIYQIASEHRKIALLRAGNAALASQLEYMKNKPVIAPEIISPRLEALEKRAVTNGVLVERLIVRCR